VADQFRRAARWFLAHVAADSHLAETSLRYRAGLDALRQHYQPTRDDQARIAKLVEAKVPEDLARQIVLLGPLSTGLDVVLLAEETSKDPAQVGALYFDLGARLGLDRLRVVAGRFAPPDHWDRLALRRLMDDLSSAQRGIARKLLREGTGAEDWARRQENALTRTRDFLGSLDSSGDLSVAKLMLASSQIQSLV
jgi:glutamate dehydrogenase